MENITIRKPDDMHLHLRNGDLLKLCAYESAVWFRRAIIMPNTLPPVNTPERLKAYRNEIESALKGHSFEPLMTFKLLPGMKPDEIENLYKAGAVAGKLYPAGTTTNSSDGVSSVTQIKEALKAMEDLDMVLSVHGEKPEAFSLDREKEYLPELFSIIEEFPSLRIVLEHVSSREAVEAVKAGPKTLAATVTAHHLLLTLDDLLGGSLKPHLFCKPVVKTPEDRKSIQEAVLSGSHKFFFGSDSAPHLVEAKLSASGSAGIYSSPSAVPLLADFFEKYGKIEMLEDFTSRFGAEFYRLPLNMETIKLKKMPYRIPESTGSLVPLMAGKTAGWSLFL